MKFKSKYPWAKAGRIVLPLFVLTLLLVASCSHEQIVSTGGKTGEALVKLSLKVPAATRSLTEAQEDAIGNLWVLAFKPNGGTYSHMAKCEGSGANYTVTLRTGDWDLVLVANAEKILSDNASVLVTTNTKAEVLNGIALENTGKWNTTSASLEYASIPMCSDPQELINKTIAEQSPVIKFGPIELFRMMARVNVGLGAGVKDHFTITSVDFYNRNTKGYLAPDRTAAGVDKAKLHDFATGNYGEANILEYSEITSDANGTACVNEIYVFEVNNTNASELALTTRPCLVVGGTYKGATCYYRVDFSTRSAGVETYLDILRNHTYVVNISAVVGPGYPTSAEAFNSSSIDIEVGIGGQIWTTEVIDFTQDGVDISIGQHWNDGGTYRPQR